MKLLSTLFLFLSVGCFSSESINKPVVLRLDELKENTVLEPSAIRFTAQDLYLENLTTRLITLGKNGEYRGQLAEEITLSPEKTKLRIKLRKAFFSDGLQITSGHVKKSFLRLILKGSNHTNPVDIFRGADKLESIDQEIEGIQNPAPNIIEFRLKFPVKELFYYLSLPDYAVLHPKQYGKLADLSVADWLKLGSGPYFLEKFPGRGIGFRLNKRSFQVNEDTIEKIIPTGDLRSKDFIAGLKNGSIHVGEIKLDEMLADYKSLENLEHLHIFTQGIDGIVHLILNPDVKIFRSQKTRQWVYRKLLENFLLTGAMAKLTKKAHQFFLPEARGYVDVQIIKELLKSFPAGPVPEVLKQGFEIKTVLGMKAYLPKGFEKIISQVLQVPVTLNYEIEENYETFLKKRGFDAHVMATSMSYKVLSEALNLEYTSSPPMLVDPGGEIKKALKVYQRSDKVLEEEKIIRQIMLEMARDSESIPLYYFVGPLAVNKTLVDPSLMHFSESLQLWKLPRKR